jgi:hypothetical protein
VKPEDSHGEIQALRPRDMACCHFCLNASDLSVLAADPFVVTGAVMEGQWAACSDCRSSFEAGEWGAVLQRSAEQRSALRALQVGLGPDEREERIKRNEALLHYVSGFYQHWLTAPWHEDLLAIKEGKVNLNGLNPDREYMWEISLSLGNPPRSETFIKGGFPSAFAAELENIERSLGTSGVLTGVRVTIGFDQFDVMWSVADDSGTDT